jgi:hypothetical protein
MKALALHLVGEQAAARRHAERALHHPHASVRSAHKSFYEYDSRVAARTHLARIAWVEGRTGEAAELVRESIEQAVEIGYAPTLLYTLTFAGCPVAFWSGNDTSMRVASQLLDDHSDDPSYGYWRSWAQRYRASLTEKEGSLAAWLDDREPLQADLLASLDPRFLTAQAVERAHDDLAPWCRAEILRLDAETRYAAGQIGQTQAQARFEQAYDIAVGQGAWSWALRAGMSLARCAGDARGLERVRAALDRVEWHSTRDRRDAEALLGV